MALYRHHGRLRDPDKALTYLRSAVLNRARSHIRWLRRARAAKVLHLIPSIQTQDAVELREETDDVYRAAAALPQHPREVVVLARGVLFSGGQKGLLRVAVPADGTWQIGAQNKEHGNFDCAHTGTYDASLTGDVLTLRAVGGPCALRRTTLAGSWTQ